MSFKAKLILTASVLLLSGAAAAGDVLVYSGEGAYDEGYLDFAAATGKTIDTQAVLPSDLSVYDCIVLPANGYLESAFSEPTLAALNAYVNAGGRIIAEAEWSFFPGSVDAMNGLASDLGADLSVVIDDLDQNAHVTNNIDPSPFTAGVTSIGYAATSEVVVAVGPSAHSLVRTVTDGITFIGVDLIGDGLFVLMGDTNVFSDNNLGAYIANDNGMLAANLCDQVSIEVPPTLVLTPEEAYNPIGTTHVLTATSADLTTRCSSDLGWQACTDDTDCFIGSCDLAGYPTFFAVVGACNGGVNGGDICTEDAHCESLDCDGGPNLGDLTDGLTDGAGIATTSYSSTDEGEDLIMACLDLDVDDSLGFIECFYDDPNDIVSNDATKGWFANFVTGGAGTYATANKRKTMQFSGIIGKDSDLPGIHGQWNATAKDGSTGKTVSCHFDTFTKLVFSGSPAKTPASTHNSATWTTGPGRCNDGSTPILTAIAVDYGEGKKLLRDSINVTGDSRFDTGGTKALTTGNLQVHSIILP